MELAPPDPSYLEMRNAIVQADVAINGGANKSRIWKVFAKRGMGYFAGDQGSNDTSRTRTSRLPRTATRSLAARCAGWSARPAAGPPIANAVVEIEGPGDLVDQTNANGRYVIKRIAPHTYPSVTASAPGHSPDTVKNLALGATTQTQNFKLHPN